MSQNLNQALPELELPTLREVFEDEAKNFNPACEAMIDRIVSLVVTEEVGKIEVSSEVTCDAGTKLDLLAVADGYRIAIELQYGNADHNHVGRLVFDYGPSVEATHLVLVAESFPPSFIKAVREEWVIGLTLMKAIVGYNSDGAYGIKFEVVESSAQELSENPNSGRGIWQENRDKRIGESLSLLSELLRQHNLAHSKAKNYIRPFAAEEGCFASIQVRSDSIVVLVESSRNPEPRLAANALKKRGYEGWSKIGKGLTLTVSNSKDYFDESFALKPGYVKNVVDEICMKEDEIRIAISELIGTTDAGVVQDGSLSEGGDQSVESQDDL